ncbi:MAG: biopolymer transporter ExbD [Opitutaceae bacterium]
MQIQDDKPYDEINITPMLDLAYVLLVIFILMTTATVQGIKANLPRGSNAPKKQTEKNKVKVISVDNSGNIFFDREAVTLASLESRLTQAKTDNPDVPVIIKGDSGTQYQCVTDVLGVVVKLGIKQVGLATKSAGR